MLFKAINNEQNGFLLGLRKKYLAAALQCWKDILNCGEVRLIQDQE